MHFKNGRPAKNGDKVMLIPANAAPVIGILYDAVEGNDSCNGRIAPMTQNDKYPDLSECLRLDDALAAIATAPAYLEGDNPNANTTEG